MSDFTTQCAVYYLVDSGLEAKQISKKLGISMKIVKEIITTRVQEKNPNIKTTSAKVTSQDLMIRETSVKGTKNVAIMTKAASEVNDEFKKQLNSTISRTARNSIYRPNKKK
jgi:NACalpha-BTF3-like transcription factor